MSHAGFEAMTRGHKQLRALFYPALWTEANARANHLIAAQAMRRSPVKIANWIIVLAASLLCGAKPGNAFDQLVQQLVGSWQIEDHDEPSVEVPGGGDGQGRELWTLEPGGMPLVEHLTVKFKHGQSRFYALLWWDADARELRGLGCGAFLASGCISLTGSWSNGVLTLHGEYDAEGTHYVSTETFSFEKRDRFKQVVYLAKNGDAPHLVATLQAIRLAPQSR